VTSKDLDVPVRRRDEQRRIGAIGIERDVGDDPVVRFLHFDEHAELVGRWSLPLRMICACGSKMLTILPRERVTPSTIRVYRTTWCARGTIV
jgi:hypothetical protein